MSDFDVRPLVVDDAPAILGVVQAIEADEPVDEHWNEADLREELEDPAADLDGGILVLDGGRPVAFGWLTVTADTAFKSYIWGGVDPADKGRGIGTEIVDRMALRALELRDRDHAGLPGELKVWLESGRTATADLLQRKGFETWRYFFRMRREMADPIPEVPAPEGYRLRPYREGDAESTRLASNESFADHWGSSALDTERWNAEFTGSRSFRPGLSQVAADPDGTVVGFVLIAEFDAETEQRGYPTAYVSRVGTTRTARGKGIASALMREQPAVHRGGRVPVRRARGGCRLADRRRTDLRTSRLHHDHAQQRGRPPLLIVGPTDCRGRPRPGRERPDAGCHPH